MYLHWLVAYPEYAFYERRHGLPHSDIKSIFRRVQQLTEGWGDEFFPATSFEARTALPMPTSERLAEVGSCTVFADGIEYARTNRGISADDRGIWFGYKSGGPAWRVLVRDETFPHSA